MNVWCPVRKQLIRLAEPKNPHAKRLYNKMIELSSEDLSDDFSMPINTYKKLNRFDDLTADEAAMTPRKWWKVLQGRGLGRQGKIHYGLDSSACSAEVPSERLSNNPIEVTCQDCRKMIINTLQVDVPSWYRIDPMLK